MPTLTLLNTFPDDLILSTTRFSPRFNPVSDKQAAKVAGRLAFLDAALQGKQDTSVA